MIISLWVWAGALDEQPRLIKWIAPFPRVFASIGIEATLVLSHRVLKILKGVVFAINLKGGKQKTVVKKRLKLLALYLHSFTTH
jgi:hypothetical protein